MTQNEAVFQAVKSVFGNDSVSETGKWSDEQKRQVYAALMTSFKSGGWTKNSGGTDEASVMKYIPGLVNNHVRKDTRLNGGIKYETKRPGSRAGSGDEAVRAMRQLLAATTDVDAKRAIQVEIDKRLAELKPKQEINAAALPENLRQFLPTA